MSEGRRLWRQPPAVSVPRDRWRAAPAAHHIVRRKSAV